MAPFLKIILSTCVVANSVIRIEAFTLPASTTTISPSSTSTDYRRSSIDKNSMGENIATMRIRGGGAGTKVSSSASASDPAAKAKRVRIYAFDSMRFFLIVNIVLGHFIAFANPSEFLFKLVSNHNAAVGAFFALSGYVLTYTSTENAQREPSPRLVDTPKQKWILSKIFGYYPLHLAVLALFSPVFLYADVSYNGWLVALWHGILSMTLTQAWFPLHAEVWNAPTWYLSALAFCTSIVPFSLPSLAKMTKPQLRRTAGWIFMVFFLPKLGYLYDFNTWTLFEGVTSAKAHPNLAVFNMLRFSPLFNVAEFLLGAVACRLVMLDGASDEADAPKTNALSTIAPLSIAFGSMYLRATGVLNVSDMIFRSIIFVPLYLKFLMAAHRNTVSSTVKDPLVKLLSNKFLVTLGNLSFPIFIAHGPVGQIFFKKIIASKLFGAALRGPTNFAAYLATTVAVAFVLQKAFLQNKAVADWSKKTVDKLSTWM